MVRQLMIALTVCAFSTTLLADEGKDKASSVLEFKMKSLSGEEVDLSKYKGKVLLIVNTASKCGLTPQYEDLQALSEKYKDKGLVVLGFPCNQFGKQEPGSSADISSFCTEKYGVTFDMFEKIDVNGESACDLYKFLTGLDLQPKGSGDVQWNFEKFLVGKDGKPIARFAPRTVPMDETLIAAIEKAL